MDILDRLLRQEAVTTRHLLLRCRNLERDQLDTDLDEGLGTLHETLVHLVQTIELWIDLAQRQPVRPVYEPREVSESLEGLIARLDVIATDFEIKSNGQDGRQPAELAPVIAPVINRNRARRAAIRRFLYHFVENEKLVERPVKVLL
jgi:uncharacterized damage-inducible protein DinB